MKQRIIWILVSSLMTLSLVMASCGQAVVEEEEEEEEVVVEEEEEEEEVVEEEVVEEALIDWVVPYWKKDPNAVPKYGGTLTAVERTAPKTFDHWYGNSNFIYPAYDSAAFENFMTTDPEVWDFGTRFTTPEHFSGALAESWEMSEDLKTMTMHIREGVYWENKPPVNGRELTAYDFEYSWQRWFGLGEGFTKTGFISTFLYGSLESITATDKYTLEIKWTAPSLTPSVMFLDVNTKILAREVVDTYGDAQDWRHTVSIGPFIIDDYVPASQLSFSRNPNYWGYDEHWPENQLPYVDKFRQLIIPDESTRMAAIRAGKADIMRTVKWEDAASLLDTNPKLVSMNTPGTCFTVCLPVDREPWSDINVRKAMQMAIDLDSIAESYYGGLVTGTPVGPMSTAFTGFYSPYEEWPQDVKDGHAYNPEGAIKLIADAGYPDGIRTRLSMSSTHDTELAQVLLSMWADIGVDVDLDIVESGAYSSYAKSGETELGTPIWPDHTTVPPQYHFPHWLPDYYENPLRRVNDPVIIDLVAQARASTDWTSLATIIHETEQHVISQFYNVRVLPTLTFHINQPWVKRLANMTNQPLSQALARCWIEPAVKTSMGY